ncbi:hypothetical protein DACRYDRAFT_117966 [Dacryopinax primogenitus]|uniref:Uncharacterized protein n=1 Tax=Dacryopinax primogenitus (strain DJM 731) TaxID=1858805 RepID=M5G066_DACPD|nr:uncharacterized protein DACRYDRAFT_117966 [Dacryopinax primogenitus]EJT99191.1 hypothetical protein DACRYDRAFT_117966 [Dacryopinax primogenitus]
MPDAQSQQQYRAATHVPLIQSPSLRIPQPVLMPQDIHPLPDSLEPYMVYPFTLESRTLTSHAHLLNSLTALQSTHDQKLAAWEQEKQRRKREALRRVAPGFEPGVGVLVPDRAEVKPHASEVQAAEGAVQAGVMDDFVAGLEKMGYGALGK